MRSWRAAREEGGFAQNAKSIFKSFWVTASYSSVSTQLLSKKRKKNLISLSLWPLAALILEILIANGVSENEPFNDSAKLLYGLVWSVFLAPFYIGLKSPFKPRTRILKDQSAVLMGPKSHAMPEMIWQVFSIPSLERASFLKLWYLTHNIEMFLTCIACDSHELRLADRIFYLIGFPLPPACDCPLL